MRRGSGAKSRPLDFPRASSPGKGNVRLVTGAAYETAAVQYVRSNYHAENR